LLYSFLFLKGTFSDSSQFSSLDAQLLYLLSQAHSVDAYFLL